MAAQLRLVSDTAAGLRATAVNSILAEVRRLQADGRQLVSLMRGEPDLGTPAHIVEAAVRSLRSGRTTYPENRGEPALCEAVAEKLLRDNGVRYDPRSEILITTGATFGIYVTLAAVLNPGDEVLLPDPIYDAYSSPIHLVGARVRSARATLSQGRFALSIEALEAAWSPACKVLLINTPWNPTGTVLTTEELSGITEFVERKNLLLLSDEIYEAMTYEPHQHVSPASLCDAARARTVLVNSLSKTYAMTGWRIGYCAGPPPIIQAMYRVLQQSSRGPATFVQDAAVAALAGPQDCVREMQAEYGRRRDQVLAALEDLAGVHVIRPQGGFFAMLDIRRLPWPSEEVRRRLLAGAGVVVVHGSAYGPGGEGTLRVSFASGGANLARGLDLLRQGLGSL